MTMDGLADRQIDDYYRMDQPLSPEPGEQFVIEWRMRVNEVHGNPPAYDPGFEVFSDDDWSLALVFGIDYVQSFHESLEFPYSPGVFHEFEIHSEDMRAYELRVDGLLVHTGSFGEPTFRRSRIEWDDYAHGSASLVDWDYFRFGVVPEAGDLIVTICALPTGWRNAEFRKVP